MWWQRAVVDIARDHGRLPCVCKSSVRITSLLTCMVSLFGSAFGFIGIFFLPSSLVITAPLSVYLPHQIRRLLSCVRANQRSALRTIRVHAPGWLVLAASERALSPSFWRFPLTHNRTLFVQLLQLVRQAECSESPRHLLLTAPLQ
jgi:hypothetical protein